MSKLHFEFLTENQLNTLEILKSFSKYGTLGGGTALALQFFHRFSYDFDIFLPKSVSKKFLYKVKQHFRKIEIITDTADELTFVSVPQKGKVTFLYYPFPNLYSIIPTSYLDIFSWKDIALDKAHTIGRRGEWRDYIDLFFIIKQGFSLETIIKGCRKKFGDSFSEKLFLSQLTYFGDLKDFTVDFIEDKYSPKEIKDFFEQEVKKLKI